MKTSEIKIKGKRFVLVPKRDFDMIRRRAAKHSATRLAQKPTTGNQRAIAILKQWESSPDAADGAWWKGLQVDIAANRFRLRPPVDD